MKKPISYKQQLSLTVRRQDAEKLTDDDLQAAEEDRKRGQRAECDHWACAVSEWWFSGKPRLVVCNECGKENFLEDEE